MRNIDTPIISERCKEILSILELRDAPRLGEKISAVLDRSGLSSDEYLELIRRLSFWEHPSLAVELSVRIASAIQARSISTTDVTQFLQTCPLSNIGGVRVNILPSIVVAMEDESAVDASNRRIFLGYALEAAYSPNGSAVRIAAAQVLLHFFRNVTGPREDLERESIAAACRFLWKFGERHLRRELPSLHEVVRGEK